MDEQKVIQVLKEIFDKYGAENLRNGKIRETVVKSYIPDMLNKVEYRDENMVLTQAMRSDVICSLVTAKGKGNDVKRAVDRLESEEHMRKEDAEFVVRCMILAQGGNPDLSVSEQVQKKEKKEQKNQEEKQQKDAPQKDQQQESIGQCVSSVSCEGGELSLYQDRLIFTSSKNLGQLEILYQNIKKVAASYAILRVMQGLFAFCFLVGLLASVTVPAFLVVAVLGGYCFVKYGSWCKKGVFVHTKTYCSGCGRRQKLFNFSCKDVEEKKLVISEIQKGMRGELHG